MIKAPVRTPDGELVGVLGIGRDITRRKEDEEKLELAALVYRNSSEAILISNADNHILAVNPAFEKITGYTGCRSDRQGSETVEFGTPGQGILQGDVEALDEKGYWRGKS